jgi:hypothetical protein
VTSESAAEIYIAEPEERHKADWYHPSTTKEKNSTEHTMSLAQLQAERADYERNVSCESSYIVGHF